MSAARSASATHLAQWQTTSTAMAESPGQATSTCVPVWPCKFGTTTALTLGGEGTLSWAVANAAHCFAVTVDFHETVPRLNAPGVGLLPQLDSFACGDEYCSSLWELITPYMRT